ncbi:MAG: hypothetical protein K1W02_08870 [Muribaculaceae bacterium]
MKKLTDFEMLSILGGTANPEECKKLQEEAPNLENNPDTTDEDWDRWGEKFDEYCFGI